MDWLMPVLLSAVLIVVVFSLLALGWRGRRRRQQDTAPLPGLPIDLSEPLCSVEGQYVVTTTAGDWLDRIVVHGLGMKSNAVLTVHSEGIYCHRTGSPDVFVPLNRLDGVRLERGMAGKFVEKDGLVVFTWRLGTQAVDTGFRPRRAADRDLLTDAIGTLTALEN